MEADLSRGHRPDGKRGRAYRRVLVRQGSALLDSDIAALGDAIGKAPDTDLDTVPMPETRRHQRRKP